MKMNEFESEVKGGLPVRVVVESYTPYVLPSSRGAEGEGGEVEITVCWLSGRPMGDAVLSTICSGDMARLHTEAYEYMESFLTENKFGI